LIVKPGRVLVAAARRQSPTLLLVGLAGWVLLLVSSQQWILPDLCLSGQRSGGGIASFLTVSSPPMLMLGWFAMSLAMMAPLLSQPVELLWQRSLARRRIRAIALFVAGYGVVWSLAGVVLTVAAKMLDSQADVTGIPGFAAATAIAIAWQMFPGRQICLNRCHRAPRLSAFGFVADIDCLGYGMTTGVWCAGSCWALMLLPLTAGTMHLPVMAFISVLLVAERMRAARPVRWGIALPPALAGSLNRFWSSQQRNAA
jgi:predicted metal-binding membrane protein